MMRLPGTGDQKMYADLAGKVIWLVGATGTLGEQMARDLVAADATVVCSGRNREKLSSLVESMNGPGTAHALAVDITSRASVDEAAVEIGRKCGGLDMLVNTTTLPTFGNFLELGDDDWEEVLQTKYLGYVRTIRAVVPMMLARGGGCIVCVTGKGGRVPRDIHLPGSSVNAAVDLLVRGLAGTYGRQGIRVLAVSPGVIASPRLAAVQAASSTGNDAEAAERIRNSNALARLGTAEEVSSTVLFALSNAAGFVNGGVLEVDGG